MLEKIRAYIKQRRERRGQGLVEYALILVLVAVVVIAILSILGPAIADVYEQVICKLDRGVCEEIGAGNADCTSESISFDSACSGSDLTYTVGSSCSGATLETTPASPVSGGCGASIIIKIKSTHPDGTVKNYQYAP